MSTRVAARAVRDHAARRAAGSRNVARGIVVEVKPLRVALVTGGLVLDEDDDFALSGLLDAWDDDHTIKVGDALLLLEEEGDYTAFDIEPAKRPKRIRPADLKKTLDKAAGALEGKTRVFTASAVSTINLGEYDGNNITGLRIVAFGRTASTGSNTFMRLKPNGLSTASTNAVAQRVLNNGASYAASTDIVFGGGLASSPGIAIAATDWATASNMLMASGVLSTRLGDYRSWVGEYKNTDVLGDSNHHVLGRIHSQWGDTTTPLTSLVLAMDAGTFTGKIVVEVIPGG